MKRAVILLSLIHILSLADEFAVIEKNFRAHAGKDYAASRGEYLNGIVMAAYLGYEFVDAAQVVFFKENGEFDAVKTNEVLGERLQNMENAVVPGFYGANPDGSIRTFSRGGSDITGSIVAKAVHADVYENWTDVSLSLIHISAMFTRLLKICRSVIPSMQKASCTGTRV